MGSAGGGCIAGAALACTGVGTVASSTGAGVAFGSIGGGLVATPGGRAVFFFADAVAGKISSVTSAIATGHCATGEATSASPSHSELPLIQEGTSSNTQPRQATTEPPTH